MQKYLMKALVAACVVLLVVACQTSNKVNPFFSPYSGDMTLAQSVRDALSSSEDPVIAQVRVETSQNHVILSGYVKKIRQSDTAEQIAREVPGVQAIENHIIVRQ